MAVTRILTLNIAVSIRIMNRAKEQADLPDHQHLGHLYGRE